ncbi:MOSC domain-containing protein [Paracoccus sp. Z330]|uniref:MOSC domain-containing protein n=1 Tax=Paracoccus onchidii TaxID=3017813 RepID=A0ABT4ZCF7_9RHOB|nr:MOSC domain-containing protein [Paracoccus onchidii]MDB6177055.1 MOSC domain-containing protein [Paracoccus onchidii]
MLPQSPQVLIGQVAPIVGSDILSGIAKFPIRARTSIGPTGLSNDAQADQRVHGGTEKALHHYPRDHYDFWRRQLDPTAILDAAGAFGENISTCGITESDIAVGDVFRLGTALIQVSQGRQPCWKLNLRFGQTGLARQVQDTGKTGWYYRVLEPGDVCPGDSMDLQDRVIPEWTIRRLWHAMYVDRLNREELSAIANLPVLADGWRKYARRRLDSGKVENWKPRLEGSA